MKAVVVLHGDRGTGKAPHTSSITVKDVTDKAAAITMGDSLAAYTTCNRGQVSVIDKDGGNPSPPANDSNMDERAVIYMKDTVNDSTVSVTLASWDLAGHPLEASAEGDRIASTDVAAITAIVNTATGKSLVPMWGKHIKQS